VNRVFGKPIESTFLGEASEHVLLVNGQRIRVVSTPPLFSVPEMMTAEFDPGMLWFWRNSWRRKIRRTKFEIRMNVQIANVQNSKRRLPPFRVSNLELRI